MDKEATRSLAAISPRYRTRIHYHREALTPVLERRLTGTTGQLFEFYDPFGGDPAKVQRKPDTPHNEPSRDYLGHNPVMAMARMWQTLHQ